MKKLKGSEKQIAWAEEIRAKYIKDHADKLEKEKQTVEEIKERLANEKYMENAIRISGKSEDEIRRIVAKTLKVHEDHIASVEQMMNEDRAWKWIERA